MGITGKKKQTSNEAAKSVNTKSARNAPPTDDTKAFIKESDVNRMSAQEYEKKADTIMEAIRAGKFIYDISGNAR